MCRPLLTGLQWGRPPPTCSRLHTPQAAADAERAIAAARPADLAGLPPSCEGAGLACHGGVRHERGFTLIEAAVVMAIIAVLAGIGFFVARSGKANANMASAAYELAIRLTGQRAEALADGLDRVVVLVDAPGTTRRAAAPSTAPPASATSCSGIRPPPGRSTGSTRPARRSTPRSWSSARCRPGSGSTFAARSALAGRPFQRVVILDPQLGGACGTPVRPCFAIRFTGDGDVRPVYPGSGLPGEDRPRARAWQLHRRERGRRDQGHRGGLPQRHRPDVPVLGGAR